MGIGVSSCYRGQESPFIVLFARFPFEIALPYTKICYSTYQHVLLGVLYWIIRRNLATANASTSSP